MASSLLGGRYAVHPPPHRLRREAWAAMLEDMLLAFLPDVVQEHLQRAREGSAGRSAHTLHGGHDKHLRQTVIALLAGRGLEEHESPGEATLQILAGRVRLEAGEAVRDAAAGDLLEIPPARHAVHAYEDSVLLLTVTKRLGDGD